MAGAVIADVAREKNLSLEEMRAHGFGPDEIEALLTKQKLAATARMAHHKTGEAEARKNATQAAKRLGALAYLYDTRKALAAYAEATQLDPDDWEALWHLGQIQMRAANLEGAKASLERLIALHSTLDNPYYIHWSYFLLGDVEATLGSRDKALGHYECGKALVLALIGSDPNNVEWQRDLCISYERVGDIKAARGDTDGALIDYRAAFDIAKKLTEKDPHNTQWRQDLSRYYNRVGDISAARGDRDGALKAYSDGLEIRKTLAARDPDNAEWQRDLSVSYNKIGDISRVLG